MLGHQARRGSGDPREEEGAAAEPRPREEVGPGSEWGRSAPCKLRRSQGGGVGTAAASDPREEERVLPYGLAALLGGGGEAACTVKPGREERASPYLCGGILREEEGGCRLNPDPREEEGVGYSIPYFAPQAAS